MKFQPRLAAKILCEILESDTYFLRFIAVDNITRVQLDVLEDLDLVKIIHWEDFMPWVRLTAMGHALMAECNGPELEEVLTPNSGQDGAATRWLNHIFWRGHRPVGYTS